MQYATDQSLNKIKQSQITSLKMFETTDEYLIQNSSIWSSEPAVGSYKNHLSIIISQIQEWDFNYSREPLQSKRAAPTVKLQLAEKMDLLDDIMESYAADIEDENLRVRSANSYADYLSLSEEDFKLKVRRVLTLLERHVAEMADYGINSEQIEDAKICFVNYLWKIGLPHSSQIGPNIVAQDLSGLFKEANIYVEKLDSAMLQFRRSNIQFYLGYLSARQKTDY